MNAPNVSIVNIPERANYSLGPYHYFDICVAGVCPTGPLGGLILQNSCDTVFAGGIPKGGSTYFSLHGYPPYFQVSTNSVIPDITFQDAILKGQTGTATVTLSPSPSPTAVTLSLTTTTGTGSAVFASNNSTSMTLTQSGTVQITGVTGSSVGHNIQLSASVNGVQRVLNFSVLDSTLTCTSPVTRGQNGNCQVNNGPNGSNYSWQFTDASNNTVTVTNTSSAWQGTIVASGSVSVTVDGIALAPSSMTVNNRTGFAFTAVNPTQVSGNSITCYAETSAHVLPSPPVPNSQEGFSCADLAFSFSPPTLINDGGPNNGYQYVTSVFDTHGNSPTKFEYIVVTDLLNSASTFYTSQCGDFSSGNSGGFIAGSQLKQNVFDHEQGTVLSHWTQYRDAQNNSANNIGTVLEAIIAVPGVPTAMYSQTLTDAGFGAMNRIRQPINDKNNEPCGGFVNYDSSQSCKYCGTINFTGSSCGGITSVPYCQ